MAPIAAAATENRRGQPTGPAGSAARRVAASTTTTVALARGKLGLELGGGVAHDSSREARSWRTGGALVWSPVTAARLSLGYEEATETAIGLTGRRHAEWMSFHVDL